jgi:hypothetical protein
LASENTNFITALTGEKIGFGHTVARAKKGPEKRAEKVPT